jgi:hypothetical protein
MIVEGRKIRFTKEWHDCTIFLNQKVRMGIVKMFFYYYWYKEFVTNNYWI